MAESSVDSYINAQPEQAMSWYDYYNDYMHSRYGDNWNGHEQDPEHWTQKVNNFFTGDVDRARSQYDAYLSNLDKMNEYKAVQSARAYDKMLDDSKIQRTMADYEKAGLNPYLLLNNGSISSGSVPTSAKGDYATKRREKKDTDKGRNAALIILAVARLAAALL